MIGQVVQTPCRSYGVVVAVNVSVPFIGIGLTAVRHPYAGVCYYHPEELSK